MEPRRAAILDQIHRLTNDPSSEHSQDIQELKGEYNRIVRETRNNISASPGDILDIFPSEVWIQIVKDALPARGYSTALLLLTMVSNKWMRTLTSVSTLWTRIELQGSQEDSLATVEVFKRLSRNALVYLFIDIPTRRDHSEICSILANIGPRIREVTITHEAHVQPPDEEMWAVLQLLLTGAQFNSTLTYIHLECRVDLPLYRGSTPEFIQNNPLPPSLRAIRGYNFLWRDFQTHPDYLEHLEAIDSDSPIERVLSHRIQLPNVKSLTVVRYHKEEIKQGDEDTMPSLPNLTSLVYSGTYRENLMRLLLCVAPQLVRVTLWVPYAKIPLLAAALPVAINLRTLRLTVESGRGEDNEENEHDVCPVYQHITGKTHGLRDLEIYVVSENNPPTPEQAARKGLFLSFLMSTISGLYTKVGSVRLTTMKGPPMTFDVVLSYLQSLPELRTLRLEWQPWEFPNIQGTYTLEGLEYFDAKDIDVSHCLRTPNLLHLGFTWGCHQNLDALTYADLRTLLIYAPWLAVVEVPESCFPSLQELNVRFPFTHFDNTHGSFKLTSLPFLRAITLESDRFRPQGTMLCFGLLSDPSMCPSLSEIKFHRCFPDWDILFLMLEKRNFMVDSAVSLIRRITVPFIPSELRAPLASILGGIYAERPPNNEIFMGGARELLLDENVSGCIECLLYMKGGCKCLVGRTGQGGDSYRDNQPGSSTGVGFAWTDIPEHGDPITVDWMLERKVLFEEFIANFATWRKRYRREAWCRQRATEMEITEYGWIARDYSWW